MIKLQFLNTTYNSLTKFHMEKIDPFLLRNILTVQSYNLHSECLMTYEVDRRCLQLDHLSLSQNGF